MNVTSMMYHGDHGRLKSAMPFHAIEFIETQMGSEENNRAGHKWRWLRDRLLSLCLHLADRYPEDADKWFERYKALRAIQ